MKLKVIIITLFVVVFLTSCTSPDGGFTRDDANDVRLMVKGMRVDSMYSDIGYNTNYGLAAVALVALKPVIKDFFKPLPVFFHDADILNERYKNENTSVASIVIDSNNLDLIKDELNEFFVKNGFTFNQYNKYRGMFYKKVGEKKYYGITVYVFPQPNQTIKLAIDKEIIDTSHSKYGIKKPAHWRSSEFILNLLNRFKKEFEEGSI